MGGHGDWVIFIQAGILDKWYDITRAKRCEAAAGCASMHGKVCECVVRSVCALHGQLGVVIKIKGQTFQCWSSSCLSEALSDLMCN